MAINNFVIYGFMDHIKRYAVRNHAANCFMQVGIRVRWGRDSKCLRRVQPTICNVPQFIYFCMTIYMFQTGFPPIIGGSKLHIQRQAFVRLLLLPAASLARLVAGSSNGLTQYVQFWAPDDRRKNRLKHVERLREINKLWNVCILLVVLCEYISDARTYEC